MHIYNENISVLFPEKIPSWVGWGQTENPDMLRDKWKIVRELCKNLCYCFVCCILNVEIHIGRKRETDQRAVSWLVLYHSFLMRCHFLIANLISQRPRRVRSFIPGWVYCLMRSLDSDPIVSPLSRTCLFHHVALLRLHAFMCPDSKARTKMSKNVSPAQHTKIF